MSDSNAETTAVVWFRHDLRLADNPALHAAAEEFDAVVPVFVWTPDEEGNWPPGGAHRWWLHHSLKALADDLDSRSSRLILRAGPALDELQAVLHATGADAVYWNKRHEPAIFERDRDVAQALRADDTTFAVYESTLLHDPDRIQTTSGGPYHVFTPFWNKFRQEVEVPLPLDRPRLGERKAPSNWPASADLSELKLTPEAQDGVNWAEGFTDVWATRQPGRAPGEQGAHQRLEHFLENGLASYDDDRDRPDLDGSSLMSPRLHHGEISPRQIWHAVQEKSGGGPLSDDEESFLSEIAWREFSYHLLHHYGDLPTEVMRDKFENFKWRSAPKRLEKWKRGQTGYPIVDAAMRQLWGIGWMHNRLRMTVASFLTKDLLVGWQDGERHFWDTLVGGDLANNSMGWQWAAGCGPDAQPFFRIFNPVTQGEKYDPNGDFVRRWVPELAALPTEHLHAPWNAPEEVLEAAGVTLGRDYPEPMVDHSKARDRALEEYNKIKNQ